MKHMRVRGQTGVEYMLAISVVVISVAAAFYLIMSDSCDTKRDSCTAGGPAKKAFHNVKDVVEAPFP